MGGAGWGLAGNTRRDRYPHLQHESGRADSLAHSNGALSSTCAHSGESGIVHDAPGDREARRHDDVMRIGKRLDWRLCTAACLDGNRILRGYRYGPFANVV